jgi:hypothetical protein
MTVQEPAPMVHPGRVAGGHPEFPEITRTQSDAFRALAYIQQLIFSIVSARAQTGRRCSCRWPSGSAEGFSLDY